MLPKQLFFYPFFRGVNLSRNQGVNLKWPKGVSFIWREGVSLRGFSTDKQRDNFSSNSDIADDAQKTDIRKWTHEKYDEQKQMSVRLRNVLCENARRLGYLEYIDKLIFFGMPQCRRENMAGVCNDKRLLNREATGFCGTRLEFKVIFPFLLQAHINCRESQQLQMDILIINTKMGFIK